jgi:hypothetical protein
MDYKTIKTLLEMRNLLGEHFNYVAGEVNRLQTYGEAIKPDVFAEVRAQAVQTCQAYVDVVTALENVPDSQRHLLRELDV